MKCKVCHRGRDAVPCSHGNKRSECRECWRIRRKASRDRAKANRAAAERFKKSPLHADAQYAAMRGGDYSRESIDRAMYSQLMGEQALTEVPPSQDLPAPKEDTSPLRTPPPQSPLPVSTKKHRCGWCGKRDAKSGRGMIPHPRSGAIGLWCEKCVP